MAVEGKSTMDEWGFPLKSTDTSSSSVASRMPLRGPRAAAAGPMKNILAYTDEELVSIDFNGNPHSAIVDGPSTALIDGSLIKVLAWYDNEWGYSSRVRDLILFMAKSL